MLCPLKRTGPEVSCLSFRPLPTLSACIHLVSESRFDSRRSILLLYLMYELLQSHSDTVWGNILLQGSVVHLGAFGGFQQYVRSLARSARDARALWAVASPGACDHPSRMWCWAVAPASQHAWPPLKNTRSRLCTAPNPSSANLPDLWRHL